MPQTQARVVGSGFSAFQYNGRPIAWLESVEDSGQVVYSKGGPGYEALYPLDYPANANPNTHTQHAAEIVTGRALATGTLTLSIRELWNAPIWYQLAGLDGVGETITDIYENLANSPALVSCTKVIKPPGSTTWRGTQYNNCVILSIEDGEKIELGALSVAKGITVAYTHKTPFTVPATTGI